MRADTHLALAWIFLKKECSEKECTLLTQQNRCTEFKEAKALLTKRLPNYASKTPRANTKRQYPNLLSNSWVNENQSTLSINRSVLIFNQMTQTTHLTSALMKLDPVT